MEPQDTIKALASELGDIHQGVMLVTPWECEEISQMGLCAMILEILQWYQFGLDEILNDYENERITRDIKMH